MKIKLRKTDILFSKYLREKIGRCQKCGRKDGLQVSHFWGRRHEATRYDEENCDILCFTDHQFFEENPAFYTEWKKKQLGEKGFKNLMVRAMTIKKRDDKLVILWLENIINNKI